MSSTEQRNVEGITHHQEWASYEKLLNNLIFKIYKGILQDEDVKSARKLIQMMTALKRFPKSLSAQYGKSQEIEATEKQNSVQAGKGWANEETGEIQI